MFPEAIDWCRENITPKYPNFRFRVANIKNKEYNPAGRFAALRVPVPLRKLIF